MWFPGRGRDRVGENLVYVLPDFRFGQRFEGDVLFPQCPTRML
jgi:hypothetical protein